MSWSSSQCKAVITHPLDCWAALQFEPLPTHALPLSSPHLAGSALPPHTENWDLSGHLGAHAPSPLPVLNGLQENIYNYINSTFGPWGKCRLRIMTMQVRQRKTNIIWYDWFVESKQMIQMNLFTKQKQTHRHRKQTYGDQRGKGVGERYWWPEG